MLRTFKNKRGYTLIEMLLVLGIIIMLVTLVLISVSNMLRSSKMNRAVNLMVSSADEARTAAITIRRTTRIDVTSIDEIGANTRMSVFGPGLNNNFEQYNLPDPADPKTPPTQDKRLLADWKYTGGIIPQLVTDGSRCLKVSGQTASAIYWYPGVRVDAVNVSDYYEAILFARIKILPGNQRVAGNTMTVGMLASIDDNGGKSIKSSYRVALRIVPAKGTSRNDSSSVTLERFSGGNGTALTKSGSTDGEPVAQFDIKTGGASSPTALLVEGVWYRVMLSVKSYTPDDSTSQPKAIVAAKLWADGQLEPSGYTVGPCTDTSGPLSNGFGGFSVDHCDAVVDDVLFDMRPVRQVPSGISITPLDPDKNYIPALSDSRYAFPLMFRPDGTTSNLTIVKITDTSTGDARYVRIDQNTGRIRLASSLEEVKK